MPDQRPRTSNRPSLSSRIAGADALFGTPSEDKQLHFFYLDLRDVRPNPNNARVHYDEEALQELAASIKQVGVLQPITVRRAPDDADVSYEIVAGERRYRASLLAGKTHVPAVLRRDGCVSAMSLIENLHREDLNPIEEAAGIQHLIESEGLTQGEAAAMLGRARTTVTKTLSLLSLHDEIKRAVLDGFAASRSQLLELAGLPPDEQLALWEKIKQGITVRELRARKRTTTPPSHITASTYFARIERAIQRLPEKLSVRPEQEREEAARHLRQLRQVIDEALTRLE